MGACMGILTFNLCTIAATFLTKLRIQRLFKRENDEQRTRDYEA